MAWRLRSIILSDHQLPSPQGLSQRGGVLRAVFYHRSPMIALHSHRRRPSNTLGQDLVGPGSGRTGARVPGFVPEEGPPSCESFPIPTDPGAYKLEIVLPGEAHAEEFFPPDSTMIKSAAFTFSSCGIHHPASPPPPFLTRRRHSASRSVIVRYHVRLGRLMIPPGTTHLVRSSARPSRSLHLVPRVFVGSPVSSSVSSSGRQSLELDDNRTTVITRRTLCRLDTYHSPGVNNSPGPCHHRQPLERRAQRTLCRQRLGLQRQIGTGMSAVHTG